MCNLLYIHINQWSLRCFSSISCLLSIHPPKLMTNWLFVDITYAQLPLQLSSRPPKLMYNLLFVDNAFTHSLPLQLSDHPPKLMFSTHQVQFPPFFFYSFILTLLILFIRLRRLFLLLSSQQHMTIHLLWKMESFIPMSTGYDFSKEGSGQLLKNLK